MEMEFLFFGRLLNVYHNLGVGIIEGMTRREEMTPYVYSMVATEVVNNEVLFANLHNLHPWQMLVVVGEVISYGYLLATICFGIYRGGVSAWVTRRNLSAYVTFAPHLNTLLLHNTSL